MNWSRRIKRRKIWKDEIFALALSFVLNRHSLFPFTVSQIIQLGSANAPGSLNFNFGDAR
jgi:hypothetical protein